MHMVETLNVSRTHFATLAVYTGCQGSIYHGIWVLRACRLKSIEYSPQDEQFPLFAGIVAIYNKNIKNILRNFKIMNEMNLMRKWILPYNTLYFCFP